MSEKFPLDLINDILHPKRIELLQKLSEQDESFSELSKSLKISSSEMSRHLNSLTEKKLVEKSPKSKKYNLSSLGSAIISLLQPIRFIFINHNFFQNHGFHGLPPHLLSNLHALDGSELISGTGSVMMRVSDYFELVQKEIKVMTNQPFPWGKPGLNVSYLVPESFLKFKDEYQDAIKVNLETKIRIISDLSFCILLSDIPGGFLFFPNLDGVPDFNEGFYISPQNQTAFQFLHDLWGYFWELGVSPKD
ncbi:ArsR family transcriptional regulator [Promethearchaeum syntrophicum]|uniref:ArsR family transcriptional regulator n=1 Tax=Promethearchaeum syntrophicum TaxID=2594042 RepID=A0A5B9DFG0_9ARCH|nr:ArsR family transcriptional regulator [Candidatus Prometheoarchaeum syntrophicum]QEE17530.1 Bacterial regulatory protein, arsR family [Candidatus Prometheoarchaeum syntrophicum]